MKWKLKKEYRFPKILETKSILGKSLRLVIHFLPQRAHKLLPGLQATPQREQIESLFVEVLTVGLGFGGSNDPRNNHPHTPMPHRR